MTSFSVWAPNAASVALVLDGERVEMKSADGHFSLEVAGAHVGSRYGFSLDGGEVRPDPRSNSQPDGVHGLSAVVDHDAFQWSDHQWKGAALSDSVIYEMHIGTFTSGGTFESAIARLDHLVSLGVDVVEIMPVAEFPGSHGWGYDGVDLFAPHHAYGGPDGLKRFVDSCHARGLAVVLDAVYNHLGPDGNYLAEFGPYFTDLYKTPWGTAVNVDSEGSPEVRHFILDNVRMWLLHYHLDGLRLDAVHAIIDTSAVHILEDIATTVRQIERSTGRRRMVVAESNANDPHVVTDIDRGGMGLDGMWSDDFHHAVHARLTGERESYYGDFASKACIAKALDEVFVYDGVYSSALRKIRGRPAGDVDRRCFVVCSQNHDQVGNRALGDRLASLVSHDQAKIAAALTLLGPNTPMLFAGEEWGAKTPFLYFVDHEHPQLAAAVAKGRKHEFAAFGWDEDQVPDPQAISSFTSSQLDWAERDTVSGQDLLDWYRACIDIRRHHLAAHSVARTTETDDVLDMHNGPLRVFVNFGTREQRVEPPGRVLLSSATRFDEGIAVIGKHGVMVCAQG